jgi:hypothetical protein
MRVNNLLNKETRRQGLVRNLEDALVERSETDIKKKRQ